MSSKKTYSEIRESLRNEISKSYKHRIEHLQNYANNLRAATKVAEKERDEARKKLRDAEDENTILRDWIERLCDYCNMTEADRQLTFEALRRDAQKTESREKFERYIYDSPLFKYLNILQ